MEPVASTVGRRQDRGLRGTGTASPCAGGSGSQPANPIVSCTAASASGLESPLPASCPPHVAPALSTAADQKRQRPTIDNGHGANTPPTASRKRPRQTRRASLPSPPDLAPNRRVTVAPRSDAESPHSRVVLGGPHSTRETSSNSARQQGSPDSSAAGARNDLHSGKPEPHGQPAFWAKVRGEICDSVPFFKAHEGFQYHVDGRTRGIVLGKYFGQLDVFTEQVIITAVGGGRVSDSSGQLVRLVTQTRDDRSYRYMMSAKEDQSPIAVIADQENPLWPCKPPHQFNALDFFHVTDIWSECDANRVGHWKCRLERIDLETRSWWSAEGTCEPRAVKSTICPERMCSVCTKTSKEVYTAGWTCLHPECGEYYSFDEASALETLAYTEEFLGQRTPFPAPSTVPSLTPALPARGDFDGTNAPYKVGMVCPECKRCNRRENFFAWICRSCGYRHEIKFPVHTPSEIKEESALLKSKKTSFPDFQGHRDLLEVFESQVAGYKMYLAVLPGEASKESGQWSLPVGCVIKLEAPEKAATRPMGPDELFLDIQSDNNVDWERGPARNKGSAREELTAHFVRNYGAYYKYGVLLENSLPFQESPEYVLKGLQRLTFAAKAAMDAATRVLQDHEIEISSLADPFTGFNELLALGYTRGSKINWHDDGEQQLGQVVATLSLGSPAKMRFRPKKKANPVARGTETKTEEDPQEQVVINNDTSMNNLNAIIQGSSNHTASAHNEAQTKNSKRRPSVLKENIASTAGESPPSSPVNKRGGKPPVLTFSLNHGDIVIMCGSGIHALYEHEVQPSGTSRFAMTCRQIKIERLGSEKQQQEARLAGQIPKQAEAFQYLGEEA